MKEQIKLFLTGFVQVFLVSMNIVFITNKQIIPLVITGFFISFTWTINVKKVAFGTMEVAVIAMDAANKSRWAKRNGNTEFGKVEKPIENNGTETNETV